MEMFVPHMTRVDEPPNTSASDVSGLRLEKVASESGSATGTPFSPTKMRLRRPGVDGKASEWMSPLRVEICGVADKPSDLPDWTNRPLLLVGALLRAGLELYRTGDDSRPFWRCWLARGVGCWSPCTTEEERKKRGDEAGGGCGIAEIWDLAGVDDCDFRED